MNNGSSQNQAFPCHSHNTNFRSCDWNGIFVISGKIKALISQNHPFEWWIRLGKLKFQIFCFLRHFSPLQTRKRNFLPLFHSLSLSLQNPKNVIFRSFQNPNNTHQIPQNPAPKRQKWRLLILLCPNSIAPRHPLNPFKWRLPHSNRPPSDLR